MPSRREQRVHSQRITLIWLMLLVLISTSSPLWLGFATRKCAELLAVWSSAMRVNRVEISGTHELSADTVSVLAAVPRDVPLLSISPAKVEQRLREHPWIREARVRRRFPQLVMINIEERVPLAIIRDTVPIAVSEDAIVLPPLRPDRVWNLPILSPPQSPRLAAGMRVADPATVALLCQVKRLKNVSVLAWQNLSEMYYSNGGICATLSQPPVELILGHGASDLAWISALQYVRASGSSLTFQTLDLRFPGRIVVSEQPLTLEHRAG